MTCVVGIAKNEIVYIGADSCGSSENLAMIVSNPKVFTIDNRFIIGVCGSFRLIDLLQYSLKIPKQKSISDDCFIRTIFITAVKDCLIKNDFPIEDNEVNFLVGYKGKLYCVEPDFAVVNPPDWGHAIGSGAEPARGSIYTTKYNHDIFLRIKTALETSEALTPSVRGPFLIEEFPKVQTIENNPQIIENNR